MLNISKLAIFIIIYGLIIYSKGSSDILDVNYNSECLVNNELYVNKDDKVDLLFSIESNSTRLNITFISNDPSQFNIEPQNFIIDYDDENLIKKDSKVYENMILYGYNYGSSLLSLNIKPIDESDQEEINKTITINVLRAEKQLFDSLLILFTVLLLFSIGTGMPLSTVIKSLKVNKAKPFIVGLLPQIIIIPLVAYGLTKIFQLSDLSSYSVMMIASSPGSLYATIFIYYIGGDKPLSLCLCLISTLLSTITFPLIMTISSLINHINLSNIIPIWQTLSASFTQLIPISIGWLVSHFFPAFSIYMSKLLPIAAALAIITSIVSSFIKIGTSFFQQWEVYVISIILAIVSYSIGWILSKLMKLNPFQCRSICFHVGMQNTTIPITIIQVSTGCLSPFLSIFPAHHAIYNMIIAIGIFLIFLFGFSVIETVVEDTEIIEYRKSLENQLNEIDSKINLDKDNKVISDLSLYNNDSQSEVSNETKESIKKARIAV